MFKFLKPDLTVKNPPNPYKPTQFKEVWAIDFHDRTSVIVFNYDTMVSIVKKRVDPYQFRHGNTKRVSYQLTKWMDDSQGYEILSSVDMDIKLI